jgi:biopolymer transport protein TolQ
MVVAAFLTAAALPSGGGVEREIPGLIATAGWVAKSVLIVVSILSVYSWAVIFQKARAFGRARRTGREAELLLRQAGGIGEAGLIHARLRTTPWGALIAAAYAECFGKNLPGEQSHTSGGEGNPQDVVERVERAVSRAAEAQRDRIADGLTGIATVANIAPFFGLFGTVWGVMNSFLSMGREGSANLAAVGPGIAEALITTVAGLAAAIPAAMAYNHFLGRLRALEADLDRVSGVIVDKVRYGEVGTNEAKRVPQLNR